jgi:hypothetical protein
LEGVSPTICVKSRHYVESGQIASLSCWLPFAAQTA